VRAVRTAVRLIVTRAMLRVGAAVLAGRGSLDDYAVVAEIYRAMVREALRTERSAVPPYLRDVPDQG
jgi:hypothetical protein